MDDDVLRLEMPLDSNRLFSNGKALGEEMDRLAGVLASERNRKLGKRIDIETDSTAGVYRVSYQLKPA